jgi:hypothetical protein
MQKWQKEWEEGTKAATTKEFFFQKCRTGKN